MLHSLDLTGAKRFKLSKELRKTVLPKYPKPKNAAKGTFCCNQSEVHDLNEGVYKYLIYSDGLNAYLFDASLFKNNLKYVKYAAEGFRNYEKSRTTFVGRVKTLISHGKF